MTPLTLAKSRKKKNSLAKEIDSLKAVIGNTPLFAIKRLNPNPDVTIYAKLEWQQFGGSVKSRPAYRIIRDAIRKGNLSKSRGLLDATSGNTGISYAHICSRLGIPLTLCLPENASADRKQLLHAFGVNIKYTSGEGGTDEAQRVAKKLGEHNPETYFYADQYSNNSNWISHYETTGPEIVKQTKGSVTHFIAGLGTTGTFTGTGRYLKEHDPSIRLTGLQPDFPLHGLEGWKHLETAHEPAIYNRELADEIRIVNTEESYRLIREAALKEGLLLSPSSAANLAGALQLASGIKSGTIVTVFPDDGSRYKDVITHIFNKDNRKNE